MSLTKEQQRLQKQLLKEGKAFERRFNKMPEQTKAAWIKLLGFMRENYAMDEIWDGKTLTFVVCGQPFCEIMLAPKQIDFSFHGEKTMAISSVDEIMAAICAKRQPDRVIPSEHFTLSPGGGRCDLCLFNHNTVQRQDRRVEMSLGFAKCYGDACDFTSTICNGDHLTSRKDCTIIDIGRSAPGLTADEVTHILFPYWYTKSRHYRKRDEA